LCEPLWGTEGPVVTVGFKNYDGRQKVCGEEQARIREGSEFRTEGDSKAETAGSKGCVEPTRNWCWTGERRERAWIW